ncbi:uncharacterized protein PAC_06027 [Phialocephala subalpina]|uniref:Uncharacterized protein n=1 Tax=Phialocephala subalpina TaxID=576137 RepID=A0A1L7WTQ5_9HELO|nr:uncharacterized protein PAC_06027 [Phialocephala subalpina]
MHQFSALPSPLSPQGAGKPKDHTICTGMAKKDRKLNSRRARQVPLPDNVSPLRRQALMTSSERKVSTFLINRYNERENKYDKAGRIKIRFAKQWAESKSPKKKSREEENFMEAMRKAVADEELIIREKAMGFAQFQKLFRGRDWHVSHHSKAKESHDRKNRSESSTRIISNSIPTKREFDQCKGYGDDRAWCRYEERRVKKKERSGDCGSWEIATATSANEKFLGIRGNSIRFGDMEPHNRCLRNTLHTPPSSQERDNAPRGARIPSRASTPLHNVAPVLAHTLISLHPQGRDPDNEAQQALEDFITVFTGKLKIS